MTTVPAGKRGETLFEAEKGSLCFEWSAIRAISGGVSQAHPEENTSTGMG